MTPIQSENINLKAKNILLVKERTALSAEKRSLARELAELVTFKKALEAQYEALAGEKAEIDKEKAVLTETVVGQGRRLLDIEAVREQLKEQIKRLTASLSALQKDKAGLAERNTTLRTELAVLGELKRALQHEHDQLRSAYEEASSENTLLREASSEGTSGLLSKLNEATGKITTLEDARSNQRSEIVKLRNEIQSLRDAYAELTQAKAQDEAGRQEAEQDTLTLIDKLSVAEQFRRDLQLKLLLETDENAELAQKRDELFEKNSVLRAQVARLETLKEQLASAQMKYKEDAARLSEEKRSLARRLAELAILKQTLQQEMAVVAQAREQLEAANQRLTQDKQSLEARATSLSEEKASLTGQLEAVGEQYKLTKVELETLRAKHADEVAAFKQERDLLKEDLEALEILKARNTELEYEYNRLIKPARSKVGRYVVRIQYWKDETGHHYALKLPGGDGYVELSRAQLHVQLKTLKEQHGTKLYTAVWFPDDTSLSHAEAVSFTSQIHSRYDYYWSKN